VTGRHVPGREAAPARLGLAAAVAEAAGLHGVGPDGEPTCACRMPARPEGAAPEAGQADGGGAPGREAAAEPAEVVREYRRADGSLSAAELEAPDGARFTVSPPRGSVSWADPQVWARPEAYGLEQFFCPGHGGTGVCPYGAHDEIRYPGFGAAARAAEREAGQ